MSKKKKEKENKTESIKILLDDNQHKDFERICNYHAYEFSNKVCREMALSELIEQEISRIDKAEGSCPSHGVGKQLTKWEIEVKIEREKLLNFANTHGLYDPILDILDTGEIQGYLIGKSLMANTSMEKLCKQYIGLYEGVDFMDIMKNAMTPPIKTETSENKKADADEIVSKDEASPELTK